MNYAESIIYILFDLVRGAICLGLQNKSCRIFSADIQHVFIYCIFLRESKALIQTVNQHLVAEFLDTLKLDYIEKLVWAVFVEINSWVSCASI